MRTSNAWLAGLLSIVSACDPEGPPRSTGDAGMDGATDAPLDGGNDAPTIDGGSDAGEDVPAAAVDGVTITGVVFPRALGCTAATVAMVTVTNSGTSTWSAADGFALAPADGTDPFGGTGRGELGDTIVAPGESFTFLPPLSAGGAPRTATTRWRMVHGASAFGDVAEQEITVHCDPADVADFDLSAVTIVASRDVRGFPVTSDITSLWFQPGTIHIDHTLRGMWPPVVIADDGTEQEATIWVFFHIGGQWYATGGERLRPDQTEKALPNPSWIGNEWLYDPGRWGVMTGYVPSPGELVGFMVVAGSTRSDDRVIEEERTGVVLVPFPADGVRTEFPPFAYQE